MIHNKGFTLIELLVVISIIALLSSVVLSALNTARAKGSDSAVKAASKQLLIESQNYLNTASNLGTSIASCATASTFFTSTKGAAILANIQSNAASTPNLACATDSTGTKFAVSVSLKGGSSFCVDNSQGVFGTGKTAQTSGGNQGTCQ